MPTFCEESWGCGIKAIWQAFQNMSPYRLLQQKTTDVYYPGKLLSLDELMMPWRDRLIFRWYIKNKRHKYVVNGLYSRYLFGSVGRGWFTEVPPSGGITSEWRVIQTVIDFRPGSAIFLTDKDANKRDAGCPGLRTPLGEAEDEGIILIQALRSSKPTTCTASVVSIIQLAVG
ncbi:hypothetical protein PR048_020695, partial [Dryococelus australis]